MTARSPVKKEARSWLSRFIQRPQQMLLRRACFQVHLWAGVLVAIYIAVIGISGSILVFKDELMPRPHLARAVGSPKLCTPATLLAAFHVAERAHTGWTPVLASCPTDANPYYQVNVQAKDASASTVYVDPVGDRIAGEVDQEASWVGFVDRLHLDLLLKRDGRQWNGVGGAILIVLALTGLVMWWPGIRNWSRGLKFNLRLNWKRINFDLHSMIGFWTFFFTLIWATTAVYFAWPSPFERAIGTMSPITTARYPAEEIQRFESRAAMSAGQPLDLDAVLQSAMAATPGARLEGFFFGSGSAPIFTVYMAHGRLGDYANTDFVYFDQRTGEHFLTWYRGVNHTLGDWLLWLSVPLHFGTSFGMAGKIVWAAAGLAFPVLAITGLLMYWNRWLSKRISALKRAGI